MFGRSGGACLCARIGTRLQRHNRPDSGIHRHEATTTDAAALVDLKGVLLDGDVVKQLRAHLDHAGHGELRLVEGVLQLADRVVQLLNLAQQAGDRAQRKTHTRACTC